MSTSTGCLPFLKGRMSVLSCMTNPFSNGVYSKRNEFALRRAFFLVNVKLLLEGRFLSLKAYLVMF